MLRRIGCTDKEEKDCQKVMAKKDGAIEARVGRALPNAMFRIELENGHKVPHRARCVSTTFASRPETGGGRSRSVPPHRAPVRSDIPIEQNRYCREANPSVKPPRQWYDPSAGV